MKTDKDAMREGSGHSEGDIKPREVEVMLVPDVLW